MKNNFYRIIMTVMAVLFTAMPSFASKLTPEMKTVMSKFGLAMGGVVAFSLILYIGLSLYNKFLSKNRLKILNSEKIHCVHLQIKMKRL